MTEEITNGMTSNTSQNLSGVKVETATTNIATQNVAPQKMEQTQVVQSNEQKTENVQKQPVQQKNYFYNRYNHFNNNAVQKKEESTSAVASAKKPSQVGVPMGTSTYGKRTYNKGYANFHKPFAKTNANATNSTKTDTEKLNAMANDALTEAFSNVNNRNLNSTIGLAGNRPKARYNRNALRVMFLGGVGEIGKNMMALEYGTDIIVIDCGATFPNADAMPGIDLVVPDITYLVQNKNRIRGIVITHGHEDHIGAIPYVIGDINCPIYGSRLANALMENKLKEFPKLHAKLVTVKPHDVVKLGAFSVEFINVCHSIAGSFAMAITCPAGVMVHTGDFKIDYTPINENYTDLTRLAELGKQGVMLLTCESTNVEREGHSMSEKTVGKTLDELFAKFKDERIFVATFASNVYRLQELLDLAEKYHRKVTFTGRSMVNVTETAYKIGEIKFNRDNFIDIDRIGNYPDNELLVITTGSQGEPMSALTRMASGDFQKIKLGEHDCIIISASPIPGNEKSVNNVINRLYQLGCKIIYDQLADVHASGHAYRDELKLVHYLVHPKFFMPVHGEFRHQKIHKDLAMMMGEQEQNIVLPQIGDVIEVTNRGIKKAGTIPAGQRLVDGLGYGDMESIVLRDRKQLSEDGIAVVMLGMSGTTGEITSGPDIISRGLVYANEDALIKEAKQTIIDSINSSPEKQTDFSIIKNDVKRVLGNFFFRKTKRRPMILTIVMEN